MTNCEICHEDHSEIIERLIKHGQMKRGESFNPSLIHVIAVLIKSKDELPSMGRRLHRDDHLLALTQVISRIDEIVENEVPPFEVSQVQKEMVRAVMIASLILDYAKKEI